MPDMWMDVDISVQVPVSLMPLVDRTDFITIEDAIAYDEAGMAVAWNFVTTVGVMTTTAVTPTTAGVHDWLEEGINQGMYSIEIPASAGTINNDAEGVGWISGETSSTLPFRGPTIGFRAAALNNALIDGGDNLDVNVAQWLGTAVTATLAGRPDVNAAAIANRTIAASVLSLWLDEGVGNKADSGTANTIVDTQLTQADDYWNGSLVIFISGTNSGFTAVATDFDAASDTLTFTPAVPSNVTTEDYLLIPGLGRGGLDILTTQMTESYNSDGSAPTVAQALHLIISYLMERNVSGTTVTAKKLDGSTTAATFTLDDAGEPTSVTRAS